MILENAGENFHAEASRLAREMHARICKKTYTWNNSLVAVKISSKCW